MSTWILVADAGHARIFCTSGRSQPWSLMEAVDHPRGMARAGEIVTDRPGRVHQAQGDGARSGADPRTDPTEVAATEFARHLADRLAHHLDTERAPRLVLVAAPHFLGLLRRELKKPAADLVSASLDRDLTGVPDHELPARLAELV